MREELKSGSFHSVASAGQAPTTRSAKAPLGFVNYLGEPVGTLAGPKKKRVAKLKPDEWHNGWRVIGVPPGALEAAEKAHPQLVADAVSWNERVAKDKGMGKAKPVPGPWDPEKWLTQAKRKPVRSKPYEVPESAQLCRELAIKAGWLAVEVVELKSESGVAA